MTPGTPTRHTLPKGRGSLAPLQVFDLGSADIRGSSYGTFAKSDVSRERALAMMSGTEEIDALEAELEELARGDRE